VTFAVPGFQNETSPDRRESYPCETITLRVDLWKYCEMRLSGLQKDVLSLYRALLKSAFAKSATEESWRNRMREPLFLLGKFCQLLYCIMFPLMVLRSRAQ
jgi:hypothetical protein